MNLQMNVPQVVLAFRNAQEIQYKVIQVYCT